MTELVMQGVTTAFVSAGRWVARCSWWCDSAREFPAFTEGFICADCFRSNTVVWPSADMVASVERVLLMRPNPNNQNWLPGESIHDLIVENADHGILGMHAGPEIEGTILHAIGDKLAVDALPVLNPRRELMR